jgi:SAM-dependent methyltransferase
MAKYPFSSSDSVDAKIQAARRDGGGLDVCKVGEAGDIYYSLALSMITRPGARVLDTGCYQGAFAERVRIERAAREVIGIDASGESIALARQRFPLVNFVHGDCETTVPPGAFDYIFAMGWLHVKPIEGIRRTLKSFAAALAPGGYLVVTGGYKNWADVTLDEFRALVAERFDLVLELTYHKHRPYAPEECIQFSAVHFMWLLEVKT